MGRCRAISGARGGPQSGFSLVEIMTVLVIIGLMSSAVILTMPTAKSSAEVQANDLVRQLNGLAEEGLLSNRITAMGVSHDGYALFRFKAGAWEVVKQTDWPDDLVVTLKMEESPIKLPAASTPLLVFEPTGISTSFVLILAGPEQSYRLESHGDGRVIFAESRL